jgi:hypothetical protein
VTTLFTLTINAGVSAQQGPTMQAERALIGYLTERALSLLEQGNSGNLLDENGVVAGSFAYTPVASS